MDPPGPTTWGSQAPPPHLADSQAPSREADVAQEPGMCRGQHHQYHRMVEGTGTHPKVPAKPPTTSRACLSLHFGAGFLHHFPIFSSLGQGPSPLPLCLSDVEGEVGQAGRLYGSYPRTLLSLNFPSEKWTSCQSKLMSRDDGDQWQSGSSLSRTEHS